MLFHNILEQLSPILGAHPVTVKRIPEALTNACYRLETPENSFALRVNCRAPELLGIDRQRELRILNAIKKEPFAPTLRMGTRDFLLVDWIESFQEPDRFTTDELADLYMAVHQTALPEGIQPLIVTDQIRTLLNAQQHPFSHREKAEINKLCDQYTRPEQLTLCFHDWHPGNLLSCRNGVQLIDWEYAAPGDPAIDLACLLLGFKLSGAIATELAERFHLDKYRLEQALELCRLMSDLWYGARFQDYPPTR